MAGSASTSMPNTGPIHPASRRAGRHRLLLAVLLGLAMLFSAGSQRAGAHDLTYALVNVSFRGADTIRVEVRCHVPALVMGVQQGHLADDLLPAFLALSAPDMAAREARARADVLGTFSLRADGQLLDQVNLSFPPTDILKADARVPRFSPRPSAPLILTARLPKGTQVIDIALPLDMGQAVVVTTYANGTTTSQALADGQRTNPIRLAGPNLVADTWDAFWRFVALGYRHILPLGLDHILFIAALTLAAPRLGELIKLATAFTLAHSLTLGLAAFNIVRLPAGIVEPVIALSIAVVAGMTVWRPPSEQTRTRLPIIMIFGLLHGLGFASALRDVGLPRGQELTGLAGFNVGVELGQISVILLVLACIATFRNKVWYRARVAVPASFGIALVGLYWCVERLIAG